MFSLLFLLDDIEGSGSVYLPKWIRIREAQKKHMGPTDPDPQDCFARMQQWKGNGREELLCTDCLSQSHVLHPGSAAKNWYFDNSGERKSICFDMTVHNDRLEVPVANLDYLSRRFLVFI
jgi:hypothetical protein